MSKKRTPPPPPEPNPFLTDPRLQETPRLLAALDAAVRQAESRRQRAAHSAAAAR